MKTKLSIVVGLLAAIVALSLFALGDRAAADGVYDPTNYEGYGPYSYGPCNDGYDNDYDQAIDEADSDCYDPPKTPPQRTSTSTATATATATNTAVPTVTNTPQPPSLGGVAQYPDFSSGGGNHLALTAVGLSTLAAVVGAAWCVKRRFAR